mgnify:CR=1 FL=1
MRESDSDPDGQDFDRSEVERRPILQSMGAAGAAGALGGIATGTASADTPGSWASGGDAYYQQLVDDLQNGFGLPPAAFMYANTESAARDAFFAQAGQDGQFGSVTEFSPSGDVPFAEATRFEVTDVPDSAFQVQLRGGFSESFSAGDVMLGVAYLRSPTDSPTASVAAVDSNDYGNHVQSNSSPTITDEWERHYFPIEFGTDTAADGRGYLQFQLGGKQQTVEVGGVAVLDFGTNAAVGDLPSGTETPDSGDDGSDGENGEDGSGWPGVSDPYYAWLVEELSEDGVPAGSFLVDGTESGTRNAFWSTANSFGTVSSLSVGSETVPFSSADRFDVTSEPSNPWDVQLRTGISGPSVPAVESGQVLLGVAYLRSPDGNGQVRFEAQHSNSDTFNSVTGNAEPSLGTEWQRYYFPIEFDAAADSGGWSIQIQMGFGTGTVDVGGLALLDFGTDTDVGALPSGAADTDDYYGDLFTSVVGMDLPAPEFVVANSEMAVRDSDSVFAQNLNGNLTSPDLSGEGVPFSNADRFEVTSDPANSYDVQFRVDIPQDISAGDVMLGVAYLRSPSDSPQSEVHAVDSNDYSNHVASNVSPTIAGEWERHYFPIEFGTDSAAAERAYVQFRFGAKQQTVEIGGFALMDFDGAASVGDLPTGVPGPDQFDEWPDVSDPYYSSLVDDLRDQNLSAAGRFVYADNEADAFDAYELMRPGEDAPGAATRTDVSVGDEVPFSEATRVDVTEVPDNAYQFSFKATAAEPAVSSGDTLLGVAYFRTPDEESRTVNYKSTENGSISANYVTKSRPTVSGEWKRFYFPIEYGSDGAAGDWFTEIWLGQEVQTIDIGGLAVVYFAGGVPVGELPVWQESPAPGWEADADQRIQNHRTAELTVDVVDEEGNAVSDADVEVSMQSHEFGFGNMVAADELQNTEAGDPYRENRKELFNVGVLENAHKWRFWENDKETADAAVDWMNDQGWDVRGHVCLWASVSSYAVPNDVVEAMGVAWEDQDIEAGEPDPSYVEQETKAHVEDIIDYYGEDIDEWEVFNELIPQPGFVEAINGGSLDGMDVNQAPVIAEWFEIADDAAPDGTSLAINDYNTLVGPSPNRRDGYETQMQFLKDQNAGLDAVGMQCHFDQGSTLLPAEIMSILDRYAENDVRLRITEFDMADETWAEEDKAEFFYWFLKTIFSHPAVDDFVVWGLIDTLHWRDDAPFYAANWEEKPALDEYRDLVFDQWWTEESGTTDSQGQYTSSVFRGEHEVTVTHDGETTTRTVTVSDDGATLEIATALSDIASQYDEDDDGSISIRELSTAAGDFASGEISLSELSSVADAFLQS